MRRPFLTDLPCAVLALTFLSCTSAPAQAPATLIRDVRVFDGVGVLDRASVLIREGRIVEVGASLAVPEGATVVEGTGMTLLPGLIDAHTHAFGDALREALVFGVTAELDMFTEPGLAAALRAEQRAGPVPGRADLFSAGVLATAPGGHGTEYGFPIPTIDSPDSAAAFVDARIAQGSDWIKIVYDDGALFGLNWPTVDRETLRALIEAAHARERLAVVHVSTLAQAREAIDAGADGLVHLFTDSLPSDDFIAAVRGSGAFVIPTLVVLRSITGTGGGAPLVEDAELASWLMPASAANLTQAFPARPGAEARFTIPLRTVERLHAAGVTVLAGTDAPNPGTAHGAALHRELELLVEAGMTPLEALRAATSAAADAFRLPERGRIAPGKRADLLLVRGDPTADITKTRAIAGVWKGGARLDRERWAREVVAAREALSRPAATASAGVISDFEDGAATARFGTPWMPNTDSFAGGTSKVTLEVVDDGAGGRALRIAGTITTSFAQPWAGAMWSPGTAPMQPADLSGAAGVRFRVRGDGREQRLLVFAQRSGMVPRMHAFTAPAEWTEITVPWSAFDTDGSDVMAILFVGSLPAGDFRFEVDDVELR